MKRRSFVKASVLTTAAGVAASQLGMAAIKDNIAQQFYELRVYDLKNQQQQNLVEDHLHNAAIPALNRLGSDNIGVFTELKPSGQSKLYVLIPYNDFDGFLTVNDKLVKDRVYQEKASAYLKAPATEPAYERIDSSFLRAFKHHPKLTAPENKNRIFELRRYEHATENAGKVKLEMFNDAGEIDIFTRLGFKPVFFGETLIGGLRPNLMYMITFDDMAAHDSHWQTFIADAEWKKISSIPEYADAKLVSRITSTMLTPANCSQI